MINENSLYKTVAEAVKYEVDPNTGDLFLTFKVTSENLKTKIKRDWNNDIPFRLIGTNLVIKE